MFCFKQKTAYEMRISDWSSDVCSSDLAKIVRRHAGFIEGAAVGRVARISGGKTRLHSLDLQGLQLRATQPLIGVEVEPVCEEAGHGSSYRQTVGRSSATS